MAHLYHLHELFIVACNIFGNIIFWYDSSIFIFVLISQECDIHCAFGRPIKAAKTEDFVERGGTYINECQVSAGYLFDK
jgi:hypothetical protein